MKTQRTAEAGMLDESFADKGIAWIGFGQYTVARIESIKSVGEGTEGKIYFAGWYHDNNMAMSLYLLGRLNADGSADKTFGEESDDGVVVGRFKGLSSTVKSLAIQPDGKILLFGSATGSEFLRAPAFARYSADGKLDRSFGENGDVVHNIIVHPPARTARQNELQSATDSSSNPFGVEILPDGKILAFKHHTFGDWNTAVGLIIRLDDRGSLDLDFNQIGHIVVSHPDYLFNHTQLMSIMVQADGKYLGCGAVWDEREPHAAMFVRYHPQGTLDDSFADRGFAIIKGPVDMGGFRVEAMAQQPNQRILGIGATITPSNDRGLLLSIEPDGSPNIQFNRGLPLLTELEPNALTAWTAGAIQEDGRIVVVGGVGTADGEVDIVVARFIDEQFDPEFNGTGYVRTEVEPGTEVATGMALQSDGKIVVAAYTGSKKLIILRYLS